MLSWLPVSQIRVMTYNIHRWAGRDSRLDVARLAQVIRAADADVVTLNEVLHPVTISGQEHDALAELAERLEMHFAFGPSGWLDRGGWFDRGADWEGPVGNAILSRYPLTHIANKLLPKLPGTKQRSLLEACLVGGPVQGLTAFATHLDHAFEGTRRRADAGGAGAYPPPRPPFYRRGLQHSGLRRGAVASRPAAGLALATACGL